MKLYLVWNEAKAECVGFADKNEANYALGGYWIADMHTISQPSDIGDAWHEIHGDEQCTITEIEV